MPNINFGQAPPLGATASFALFSAHGAFNEQGSASTVTGDVGTFVGAFNLFPPGTLMGQKHVADGISSQAATAVAVLYSNLSGRTCGSVHGVGLGSSETLSPNVYCLTGASTLNGNLILDGGGDSNSVFIFKINGAFATTAGSTVTLINSASLCNVFWQVNGEVDLGPGSVFRGTIVANGVINLLAGATLEGRGLTQEGAVNLYNNTVTISACSAQSSTIPTLSEWGLIIFGILLLGFGIIYILRRKQSSMSI